MYDPYWIRISGTTVTGQSIDVETKVLLNNDIGIGYHELRPLLSHCGVLSGKMRLHDWVNKNTNDSDARSAEHTLSILKT